MAKLNSEQSIKQKLSIWASLVPLAICVVYSVFYLASGLGGQVSILSPSLDVAVWGVALFVILARLGYDLELNVVKGHFLLYAGAALIVVVCGMAVGVVAVILGLLSSLALVVFSLVLLSLYVLFSLDFFGINRLQFFLRLIISIVVVGALVALAGFLA